MNSDPVPIRAFTDNYIWALLSPDTDTFICVDPGDADPVITWSLQSGRKLSAILLTHHHHDHVSGVPQLLEHFPGTILFAPKDPRIPWDTVRVGEGDTVRHAGFALTVWETPGHTATHISYLEKQHQWFFCGDTLFACGCGRVFDSSAQTLYQSLVRIRTLPDTVKLFPAHEYTRDNVRFAQWIDPENPLLEQYATTISRARSSCTLPVTAGHEKTLNPFLRTDNDRIARNAMQHGCSEPDPGRIFVWLRTKKDNFVP